MSNQPLTFEQIWGVPQLESSNICPYIEEQCGFWQGDQDNGQCIATDPGQCPIKFKGNLR